MKVWGAILRATGCAGVARHAGNFQISHLERGAKSFFAWRAAVCLASPPPRPWSGHRASLQPLRGGRPTLQSPSPSARLLRPHLAGQDLRGKPRRNRCATSPLTLAMLVRQYKSLQVGSEGALPLLTKLAHLRHAHRHRRAILRCATTRMCLGGLCDLCEE